MSLDNTLKARIDETTNSIKRYILSKIPKKTSQLENDSGFITEHQSLDDYYTKTETDNEISIAIEDVVPPEMDLTNYIQKSETQGLVKNDGTIDTSNYIKKSNLSGLLRSDGTIDGSTYLTQHQSLANYYTKTETNEEIADAIDDINLSNYYTKTESDNKYLTEHQSLENYVETDDPRLSDDRYPTHHTHSASDIDGYDPDTGGVDLTAYYTKGETDDQISDAINDIGLTNYIQKSNTQGLVKNDGTIDETEYLTEHQSLTNYIQKSNTSGLIKNDGTIDTNTYLTQHQPLTNYIQKTSPFFVMVTASKNSNIKRNELIDFTVTVKDYNGNPISGLELYFVSDSVMGSWVPYPGEEDLPYSQQRKDWAGSGETNENGKCTMSSIQYTMWGIKTMYIKINSPQGTTIAQKEVRVDGWDLVSSVAADAGATVGTIYFYSNGKLARVYYHKDDISANALSTPFGNNLCSVPTNMMPMDGYWVTDATPTSIYDTKAYIRNVTDKTSYVRIGTWDGASNATGLTVSLSILYPLKDPFW